MTIAAGTKVQVMVRPENLQISHDGGGSIEAVIKPATYLGHSTEYLVASGPQLLRVLELRRRSAVPLQEGTAVGLRWDWENAVLFQDQL
jgi:ABC-type Fe3+/spermidine/putrescine transport system ATPase subunit